jgi:signal transduction histidine kinase
VWAASALAIVFSLITASVSGDAAEWVPAAGGAFVIVALLDRRHGALILAVGAGFTAAWSPSAPSVWPTVAALTLLSVMEDRRESPVAGWVGGIAGCVVALVLDSHAEGIVPFLSVALGGGAGLLVRSRLRVVELVEHTDVLEQHARWLEQRSNVARELHDVVGHHVTAMVVQAEAGLVGDPERALREIGGLGRTALGELDALVVHLRDPDAALVVSAPPRLSDIDELLAASLRYQGVVVSVAVDPDVELDETTTLTAYRIVQEALTNVSRHAQAGAVWVEVAPAGRNVRLRVSDDGIGPPTEVTRGAGLVGIEERVAALDGVWSLSQRPGGGTIVDVYLPVASR